MTNQNNIVYVSDLKKMGTVGLLQGGDSYNVERYSWAYAYWKRQQQIHWLGEEIPLGNDIADWKSSRITDPERDLLTHIFRFFTQSDIEVGSNYMERYIPLFRPLEIRMMLAAFTNVETVHIDAYALLLTTLSMPQVEFEAFRQYKEMSDKADYMKKFGMETTADVSRTLAMFGAFTEGMALFASFAMLLHFPRFNKMNGMGQILAWSVRDESLHCEAIIRLFHQWNKETGALTRSVIDDIKDVALTMVSLEDKFIELAFGITGSVTGMCAQDIQEYIRFIADWRLAQLKIQPLFGYFDLSSSFICTQSRPHPLPWLPVILNGVEHANFFEQKATEYSKGSTSGTWVLTWDRFEKWKKNS